MAGSRDLILGVVSVVVVGLAVYLVDPTLGGLLRRDGFTGTLSHAANYNQSPDFPTENGHQMRRANLDNPNVARARGQEGRGKEGFTNLSGYEGPATFGNAETPQGCYPRDQLTPGELLPKDQNSVWSQQNPMGTGSLKGKNFLSAGALIGINTVGQSMRNANYQLRSEPPNPQVAVSVFNQSTIEPDTARRSLEIS